MGSLLSTEMLVLGLYVTCLVLLLFFSLAQLRLTVILRRHRPCGRVADEAVRGTGSAIRVDDLPNVTIQLPIYNERYVVDRLLHAVSAIEYPRERLEIQVLDDSTDITRQLVADLVNDLRAMGLAVAHIHREHRAGFKAGALANGLAQARGELVAIFDADFVPSPDFLQVAAPHFSNPQVAAVQARWGYINEQESALTRVQAFMLDLHFRLEQPARFANGLFLNFNGTAGVWRRAAIEDAGGWSARTVTEDIDLSYRAQLRGWRIVYLDDHPCPGELPSEMSGLRSQQYRWIKGGSQKARLHLAHIVRSNLRPEVRQHACQHLLAGSTYLVILAAIILSVPLAALKNTTISANYADYGIPFAVSTFALVAVFHSARRPEGMVGHLRFAAEMLRFMVFTMGLAVHNGMAVLSGWVSWNGEFVRTPKCGAGHRSASAYARRTFDMRVLRELCVLVILAVGLAIGWHRREFAMFPLQLIAMTGLTWVITLSVWQPARASWSAFSEANTTRRTSRMPHAEVTEEALQ